MSKEKIRKKALERVWDTVYRQVVYKIRGDVWEELIWNELIQIRQIRSRILEQVNEEEI